MDCELDINILYQAIESNVNISLGKIETDEGKKPFGFVSQFFEYNLKKKLLLIALPSATDEDEKEEIVLKKNDEIHVFFIYKGFRFLIHSTVLGLAQYKLLNDRETQALVLLLPDKLLDGERRNFFKVVTPPFAVDIEILDRMNEEIPIPGETAFKGIVFDISGGGIAIVEHKAPLPFELKDILDLTIHLENETLHMEGRILNRRKNPSGEKWVFGIEYTQKNMDITELKRNVAKIMHYVMKRQREIIFR